MIAQNIAWSMQHLLICVNQFQISSADRREGVAPTRDGHRARAWLLHVDDLVPKESCVLYAVTLYSLKNGC